MAPLVLDGETLGQKQHSFNKLVEAAVADESTALLPLDYDAADVDNLLKIDVACRRRDVGYVLTVLQCEDMLYVSRAIKQATWLITDDQYAHIINPKHLHDELFPNMMSKAKNKLVSAIKINLKNEARVDEFFNYFEDDLKVAQKWLPRCSLALIEKVYRDNAKDITIETFKRLCERSISVLKIINEIHDGYYYYMEDHLEVSKILLSKYGEDYLKIIESIKNMFNNKRCAFGLRATRQLMQHCSEKVVNEFEKFFDIIHLPTFAKYLKKEKIDIQGFLLKQAENKKMKNWFKFDNIKHFVKYLPKATRFQFLKKLFIDQGAVQPNSEIGSDRDYVDMTMPCSAKIRFDSDPCNTNANIYRWYRFAPFDTAFTDLKKLIRVELSPAERTNMLTILINCAGRNLQQIQTLLQYYREHHMNEPFKFKVHFVNSLLSSVSTHKFDPNTWAILNDIFSSMEVYIESENSVPYCIKAIIVYKLLQKEDIPDIIIKKHTFDTFKDYRKKLGEKERDVLFKYLYNLDMGKLQKLNDIKSETEMLLAVEKLNNILLLLKEWEMKLSDHPEVLNQVRRIIRSKKEHSIKLSLISMYIIEKKWKKDLFEESLALQEDDAACVHALKHDPGLLLRYSTDVAAMTSNDAISLKNTLSKLRIYWSQSLAQKWVDQYLHALEKPTGHKATIEGICILLPRKKFHSLLEKYTPEQTKIDWSNTDTGTLSVQKNIGKRMKLIRPSLTLDAILTFAKDDYLQFTLPSLNAALYNMSPTQVSKYIPLLFDSPVSLKKHGVRLAYTKLKFSEIKDLIERTWQNTNNVTIKTVLFKETFDLLKKERKDSAVKELWELLSMFIEHLTADEHRITYNTLGNAGDVPLLVRPQFLMKAYMFLESLPAKANCENILRKLARSAPEIINQLEPSFVEQVLLEPVDKLVNMITENVVTEKDNDGSYYYPIITAYIIKSNNEESQYAIYEKYLIPILNGCFKSWKIFKNGGFTVRRNCLNILESLLDNAKSSVLKTIPLNVKIFKDIENRYRSALPLQESYSTLTYWTIATLLMDLISSYVKQPVSMKADNSKEDDDTDQKWKDLCTELAPLFGKSCLNFIKQDISSNMHSLAVQFAKALSEVFDQMQFTDFQRLLTLKNMLDSEVTVSYLIVLEAVSSMWFNDKDEEKSKLKLEIYDKIKLHSSPEITLFYHEAVYSDSELFEDACPYI